ncbi:MAG: sensor histidine kinase [Candidatus Methylacidiphilales bacterium]|nr:histidine kinase [Candidatus Methylacidiphilales bacterium]
MSLRRHHDGKQSVVRLLLAHPLYWACQISGWGCVVMVHVIHMLTAPPRGPEPSLAIFVVFGSLALSTHMYRAFVHLAGWRDLSWQRLLPRAVAACLTMALFHAILIMMFIPPPDEMRSLNLWVNAGHLAMITAGCFWLLSAWSGLYFGYHLHQDYQRIQLNELRLQAALREAEHRALSAQINPHFLFNSFNTINYLIEENPQKAKQTVTELARLFRASLKKSRENLITLREEMETVRSYLSLEKSRFEDRLVIHENIPDAALDAMLPPFLLQTLIENAIKYGMDSRPQVEIDFRASVETDGLRLSVTNPGEIRAHRAGARGIGLENSRLRLELLFGKKAFLNLRAAQDDVVLAEALIPQAEAVS